MITERGDKVRVIVHGQYLYSDYGATGTVQSINADGTATVTFDCSTLRHHDATGTAPYDVYMRHLEVIERVATVFDHEEARAGKIGSIKALRAFHNGLSLKEAKEIVESIAIGAESYTARDELSKVYNELANERQKNEMLTEQSAAFVRAHADLEVLRDQYNRLLEMLTADQLVQLLRK